MLLFVLSISLAIFCFGIFVVLKVHKDTDSEIPLLPGTIALFVAICAIIVSISTNSDINAHKIRQETQNEIIILRKERKNLMVLDADRTAVAAYNDSVRDLKQRIEQNQERLRNPFTNWYTCYVWNEFDTEQVQYITFTITEKAS